MNKNEIMMIEKELNISLPELYKKTIENNPLSDKNRYSFVYDSLYDDANEIIKMNINLRDNGLQNKKWPINLFAIGTNGVNCYYFIVLDEKDDGNIYFISDEEKYNPQKVNKHLFKKSYDNFIEHMVFMQNLLNRRKDEIESKKKSV